LCDAVLFVFFEGVRDIQVVGVRVLQQLGVHSDNSLKDLAKKQKAAVDKTINKCNLRTSVVFKKC
jgi:hypothetical protein